MPRPEPITPFQSIGELAAHVLARLANPQDSAMPRPKNGYRLRDGTEVPGTTTITNRFMDKSALLHWAFKQGKSGARSLYQKSADALDIGTVVHGAAELALKGRPHDEIEAYIRVSLPDEAMRTNALKAYEQFSEWRSTFRVSAYKQEISLVSERHRYGGTLDIMANVGNELGMVDLKTTSTGKPYPDHLVQLAAYKGLWDENYPTERLTGGFHLILLPKNGSKFAHYYYPQLRKAWSTFILYRQAYDMDRELADPRMLAGIPVAERSARRFVTAARPAAVVAIAQKPRVSPWAVQAE